MFTPYTLAYFLENQSLKLKMIICLTSFYLHLIKSLMRFLRFNFSSRKLKYRFFENYSLVMRLKLLILFTEAQFSLLQYFEVQTGRNSWA